MKNATEGILYPKDALGVLSSISSVCSPVCPSSFGSVVEVPHASWQVCKSTLDSVFSGLSSSYEKVFVLAPLHKGKISFDDVPCIYTPLDGTLCGSDWSINLSTPSCLLPYVVQNDDICTEEHSLEVIAPYIAKYLPLSSVCYALAPESGEVLTSFCKTLASSFPSALILVSNNSSEDCAFMWKKALRQRGLLS